MSTPLIPLPHYGYLSAVIAAPFGRLGIATQNESIREILFLPPDAPLLAPANPLAELAAAQLKSYLADPASPFVLPLTPRGSPFRQRIWAAIAAIPCGQTRTYGQLAAQAQSAARAVGQACGDNPFPLVIPCHRVVAAGGIGGFAHDRQGYLIEAKQWLLRHEGAHPAGLNGPPPEASIFISPFPIHPD